MSKTQILRLTLSLFVLALQVSCVSVNSVNSDYQWALGDQTPGAAKRTVIFFLIDGLPLSTLTEMTAQHRLPQIEKFFLSGSSRIYRGHTIFPSLTFPSITTVLTGMSVDEHGIIGNHMALHDQDYNFESPLQKDQLNDLVRGKTVFARVAKKGGTSVSFDYSFAADSTASLPFDDLEAGFNVINQNYEEVDDKIIESLSTLLRNNSVDKWPNFIFVHLVGVDFTSHDNGPRAPEVRGYLEQLDAKLKKVFKILKNRENDRSIVTLLSSDHGFDHKITKVIDLETTVRAADENIKMTSEGRFASLFFPPTWPNKRKESWLEKLAQAPDMALTALGEKNKITVYSGSEKIIIETKSEPPTLGCSSEFRLRVSAPKHPELSGEGFSEFACSDFFDKESAPVFLYPYLVSNFAHYFRAVAAPDALVIPLSGVALDNEYEGQHGGLMPEEVMIPILMRNAVPTIPNRIIPNRELLNFL